MRRKRRRREKNFCITPWTEREKSLRGPASALIHSHMCFLVRLHTYYIFIDFEKTKKMLEQKIYKEHVVIIKSPSGCINTFSMVL